jgi:hypothetical protein
VCYHQILGPCRHFPKLANGCYRHSDVSVRLDPHLTWQATKSYVERGNAFGLILHQGSLTIRFRFFWSACGARHSMAAPPSTVMNSRRFTSNMAPSPVPPVGEAGDDDQPKPRTHCSASARDQPSLGSSMCSKANTLGCDGHGEGGASERARREPLPALPPTVTALTEGSRRSVVQQQRSGFSAIFEVTPRGLWATLGYKYGP